MRKDSFSHVNMMTGSIPFLIHQTWRDSEIPGKWRRFQDSWLRHHPTWEYRLWTDLDLRELIRQDYSWFLPVYDHYPEPIQRVDAARYFLLHRHGGVYADLDFECLKPFDSLLPGKELILSFEPKEHCSKEVVKAHGFSQVACNALMASSPGHPFWEHVFLHLLGAHRLPGPLTSTGPFMLTRALESYSHPGNLDLIPSAWLYPGTSEDAADGKLDDTAWRSKHTRESYAIHHWSGSWIPRQDKPAPRSIWAPVTVVENGRQILSGDCAFDTPQGVESLRPRVSCLMVTSSTRLPYIRRAIECFQSQTYPSIELIIVDDGESDELASHLRALNDPRLVHIRLEARNQTLGALRNLAVSRASGEYVMQWDDDDLHHPRRIEIQMSAMRSVGADACLLARWTIWWPEKRRLAVSKKRAWEGSVLCAKAQLPRYDETRRRGEDTPAILQLASRQKVAFLDAPWLYTYIVHGENTTPGSLLDAHWAQATEFYWDCTYAEKLRSIAADMPAALQEELVTQANQHHIPQRPRPSHSLVTSRRGEPGTRVLILSPVKNGIPCLRTYLAGLLKLSYPSHLISVGLLESDSTDGTFAALSERLPELRKHFARAELFKRDYHYHPSGSRSDPEKQLMRRSLLARSRNYLLSRALRNEDWVLWLDFDVTDYPDDIIQQLLSKGRDIVVPHCVLAPGSRTFDLNTFIQVSPATEDAPIAQPLRGQGRVYLEALGDQELVEVDAVGGTVLLVKADLHREGLIFPAVPYKKHIETEGLSFLARDMGVRSWAAPGLEVIHANH